MANFYVIWKPRARSEMSLIENRVGMKKDVLKDLFKTVATGHRDSICVDLTEKSPAPLRLNIWNKIQQVHSSDDESD